MVLELKHGEAIALGLADGMPWGLVEDIADWLDNNRKVCIDVHYMHATSAILPLEEAARRRQVRLFCYFTQEMNYLVMKLRFVEIHLWHILALLSKPLKNPHN